MTCIHEKPLEFGELVTYPNILTRDDPKEPLHAHPRPHLTIVYPAAGAVVRMTRYNVEGEPVSMEFSTVTAVEIPVGTTHGLELVAGDRAVVLCIFSKYGPDGLIRDPKLISDAKFPAPRKIDAAPLFGV